MLWKIAWRNVWRNRRRSLITLAASSAGLAVLIVVFSLGDGIHAQLVNDATRTSLGHFQVLARGYREDPVLDHAISDVPAVRRALEGVPGLAAVLPRVEVYGLASSAANSVGVEIVGVDARAERAATRIPRVIVDGSYLDASSSGAAQALLGARLASRLKLARGEKVVLLAQGADGSLASGLFRVRGVFKTGDDAMDLGVVFVTLPQAQKFLVLGGRVTSFVGFASDVGQVDALAARAAARLGPDGFQVLTWKQLAPSLLQAIQLDDASIYILLIIVFFIVALGIVNTLLMSVFERTRELGVLLAMGMSPGEVIAMISLESLALGLVSLVGGAALGAALSLRLQSHGIDLTRWTQGISMAGAFMEPVLYAKLRAVTVFKSSAIVLVVTLLAGLYPAVKASRLSPVDSLRSS